jgi:hypothetical protein
VYLAAAQMKNISGLNNAQPMVADLLDGLEAL